MKTKSANKLLLLPLALAFAVPAAQAAQVEVNWDNPDSFRDIRATSVSQHRFQERVLTDLGNYFKKAGEKLPADQTLVLNITDVDLAGYIEYFHPFFTDGVRVIRDIDFPAMKLDYELRDSDGKVISAGTGKLKDMSFRFPEYVTLDLDPLKYEKNMIDKWYKENF